MKDEKKGAYVPQKDFMSQVGVVWMFITFAFMVMIMDDDQVFKTILFFISLFMTVVYMGYSLMLSRRGKKD